MEGASEHSTKSTCELPHPAGARPYLGVVYAGREFQCQIPRLDLLRTIPIGQDKNTNIGSRKTYRLLDRRTTHGPGKRGRLWAQPLHQHICVGGPTSRTHWSSTNNHQTSDRKASSTTAYKTKTTTTAANNSSGSSKCRPNSRTDGWGWTRQPWVCCVKRHN